MKLMKAALAFVLFSVAPSSSASAQCSLSIDYCGSNQEHTTGPGGSYGNINEHGNCKQCQQSGVPVSAGMCHECATELTSVQHLAYLELQNAGKRADVDAVLLLARRLPASMVEYNVNRNAVQIKNCSGREIIGSLPLRSHAQVQLAMALPRENKVIFRAVTEMH